MSGWMHICLHAPSRVCGHTHTLCLIHPLLWSWELHPSWTDSHYTTRMATLFGYQTVSLGLPGINVELTGCDLILRSGHLVPLLRNLDTRAHLVWLLDYNGRVRLATCAMWMQVELDLPPRYEFAANEFVSCIVSVPLETMSTESGVKDFIAVGTTINRGEDLAVKGAVRMFRDWSMWLKLTWFHLGVRLWDCWGRTRRKYQCQALVETEALMSRWCEGSYHFPLRHEWLPCVFNGTKGVLARLSTKEIDICYGTYNLLDLCARIWPGWTPSWGSFSWHWGLCYLFASSQESAGYWRCCQECLASCIPGLSSMHSCGISILSSMFWYAGGSIQAHSSWEGSLSFMCHKGWPVLCQWSFVYCDMWWRGYHKGLCLWSPRYVHCSAFYYL